MQNLLVTGGAGFIGSNFIRYLLDQDPTVRIINLDKLTYASSLDNLNNLPSPEKHTLVKGDICDMALVQQLLRDYTIDTIVHFAAESHVDRSIADPWPFVQSNIVGTYTLLEAARKYWLEEKKLDVSACRFHHISTDEVYGSLNSHDPAFTEVTRYAPNSPYSASKASSDHLVRAYHHTYGLPVTMSNCSNNYGPYQHLEKFIPKVINCCLQFKPIPIYGDGTNIRDWLYVDDHCRAIVLILQQGRLGEVYNVGGLNEVSSIDIANFICETMDVIRPQQQSHASLITFVTDRPGHDWRYAIDISKIANELGWAPQENFATGLKKTLDYYLNQ